MALTVADYLPGDVVWANLDPTQGSEQAGRRPVVVVSSELYNESVPNVLIVVPVTTSERTWPTRVLLQGTGLDLERASYAMSEQPRTVDRKLLGRPSGRVDEVTLDKIRSNLARFLDLPSA